MSDMLELFCLVDGKSTSNAFSVEVSAADSVDDLKKLIKLDQTPAFDDITANMLTLWGVSIPVIDGNEGLAIALDSLDVKKKLLPTTRLRKLFPESPEDDVIHIIVQRPPRVNGVGVDDDITLEIIIKGRIPRSLIWEANTSSATIDELLNAIYDEHPSFNSGPWSVVVEPPNSSGYVLNDKQLRTELKICARDKIQKIFIRLEVPRKPFSDFTTSDAYRMYGLQALQDFKPINDIESIPFSSEEHIRALDDLYITLRAATKSMPPKDGDGHSSYISVFLMHAVALFPDLKLVPEKKISGARGYGQVHYAIESKSDSSYLLAVTRSLADDTLTGVAQNMVQLDTISSGRKRKFEDETEDTTPVVSYGIATDSRKWLFVQCKVDTLHTSEYNDPIFHTFKIPGISDFSSDSWKNDTKDIFGHIVWLLSKMVEEKPNKK
ncbi:hypothetical protein BGX21_000974 [Mortierella sp. AD011]|nr:hypothetical protein BGX20_007339 [Mortierella sp. AD010]KAF9401660.1 hypothetical protein BGX21_000974 [Mortierella sp. AD011]